MSNSNAQNVKNFTEGYTNTVCPCKPEKMDKNSVFFIIRMVMSELDELATTVTIDTQDRDEFMQEALNTRDKCKNFEYNSDIEIIGAQADAMVDAWYYMLNIAAKHGMNLSKLFDIIHEANMNKRDPKTGKFIRRESDGKVIKPEGWMPPDIEGEIKKQMEEGSW